MMRLRSGRVIRLRRCWLTVFKNERSRRRRRHVEEDDALQDLLPIIRHFAGLRGLFPRGRHSRLVNESNNVSLS